MTTHLETTISMLKTLNLHHTSQVLKEIFEKAREKSMTYEKFLEETLREEIKGREKRKLEK